MIAASNLPDVDVTSDGADFSPAGEISPPPPDRRNRVSLLSIRRVHPLTAAGTVSDHR